MGRKQPLVSDRYRPIAALGGGQLTANSGFKYLDKAVQFIVT